MDVHYNLECSNLYIMDTKAIDSFEQIINQYQKEIINFHYRFIGNRFEAEDCAQETFVKAFFKLKTLQDVSKLRSWLYQIARHTVIDYFRKNKKYANDVAFDSKILENFADKERSDLHQEVLDAERARELERCIGLLGGEDQKIIKLLYYEGFSYNEIGELMNMNQNTLKSRLHRARRILAEAVRSSGLVKYSA